MERPPPRSRPRFTHGPNWWTLGRAIAIVRAQVGSRGIADPGFLLAVNQHRLPVKVKQLDRRANPPTLTASLLLSEENYLDAHINNVWILRRRSDRRPLAPPYALFFWGPKRFKELWPSDADAVNQSPVDVPAAPADAIPATGGPPAKITAKEARRLTPIEWAKRAAGRFPRKKKDESREQYFDRLTKIMARELQENLGRANTLNNNSTPSSCSPSARRRTPKNSEESSEESLRWREVIALSWGFLLLSG